ncbi:MAG: type II toxin-antitoxin system RelE/ParE family toxin [candidate division NC10 bacterium]|nr:type II toxin-antitoxin system RelE/ParE family toxin [candidate division NC10 bacterium]
MNPGYELILSPAARRDLKKLPVKVQEEIAFTHLPRIRQDPFQAGEPLVGTLKGERAYHFGRKPEYRIIYFVEGQTIVVTIIGTREGIYKKAKRRR